MKNYSKFIAALLVIVSSIAVSASSEQKIVGTYVLGGKTLLDPPGNEPKNTHFRIYLSGASAKAMYDAMKVKAVKDECLADGSISKSIGGTECTVSPSGKVYSCSFAINIQTQRVEPASVC